MCHFRPSIKLNYINNKVIKYSSILLLDMEFQISICYLRTHFQTENSKL